MKSAINTLLVILSLMLLSLLVAQPSFASECVKGTRLDVSKSWKLSLYGTMPTACLAQCRFKPEVIVEAPANDSASASYFMSLGEACAQDGFVPGGYIPPPIVSDDLNGNGIHDDIDDFDGDGIPNSVDDDPFQKVQYLTDDNQNGIPDELEAYLDKLNPQLDITQVNCTTAGCPEHMQTLTQQMAEIASNNGDLVRLVREFVSNTVMTDDIKQMSNTLSQAIRQQTDRIDDSSRVQNEQYNRLRSQISNLDVGSSDPSFTDSDRQMLSDIKSVSDEYANNHLLYHISLNNLGVQVGNVRNDIYNISHSIGNEAYNQVTSAINNSLDSGLQLNATQSRQLRNAAAAKANGNKIKAATDKITAVDGKVDELKRLITEMDTGSGDGENPNIDLSGVTGEIKALGNTLQTSIDGLAEGIGNIESLLGGENQFQTPTKSNQFDSGFLFQDNKKTKIETEIVELEKQLKTEMDSFKTLFSFDTDSFQDGEYKEHSLDLELDGQTRSFQTGVLSALLDNANIIKAVVLFIFVLMGIRMLGKE